MSQMFMVMKVEFEDDGLPVFAEHRMAAIEHLANLNIDPKEGVAKALDALGKSGEERDRLRHIVELWEKYLRIQEFRKLSPIEYEMVFVVGSSGQEFARDFANMFATYVNVERIVVTIWSHDYFTEDDGTEFGIELELKPKAAWRKFAVENDEDS